MLETPTVRPAPEQGEDIAVAITLSTQINDKRSIVMQTYIRRDEAVPAYHGILDKLTTASDRQEAKYRRADVLVNLSLHQKTLKQLEEDFPRVEANIRTNAEAEWQRTGKKGPVKLSTAEEGNIRTQRSTTETNIKRYRQEILKLETELAECDAILAKDT